MCKPAIAHRWFVAQQAGIKMILNEKCHRIYYFVSSVVFLTKLMPVKKNMSPMIPITVSVVALLLWLIILIPA
jgi:hypothetical protein